MLAVVAGATWLTTFVDGGMGSVWGYNAVRNWEQFGFFDLHGKLVVNPGGFAADTKPECYAGHRPASMVPVFLCHHLLNGADYGFFVYYALLAAMVLLSVWQLLGRTERAFWLAATVVLTPGYIRWQTSLDPNLVAVLFGFPFCAAILGLLRQPKLKWPHWLALFLLILLYSSLNWSTILVHATLFVTLLVVRQVSWRHLFIYAGLAAALAGFVLVASLSSKMARSDGSSSGLSTMLGNYGWSGNSGYGVGLTTKTAFLRLLAANLIGLLPALFFLGWHCWRRGVRLGDRNWVCLLPAGVPLVEVVGMRNYFGHHPWMSIHFILLGIILAAVVWKEQAVKPAAVENRPRTGLRLGWLAGWLAVAFAYSLIVLAIGHANVAPELNLIKLVRENTARATTLVIRRDTDPALANMETRLPELFDRHLVVVPDAGAASLASVPVPCVILTAANPPAGKILAQTAGDGGEYAVTKKLLGWYAGHIARRRADDKLQIGETNFLCAPAN